MDQNKKKVTGPVQVLLRLACWITTDIKVRQNDNVISIFNTLLCVNVCACVCVLNVRYGSATYIPTASTLPCHKWGSKAPNRKLMLSAGIYDYCITLERVSVAKEELVDCCITSQFLVCYIYEGNVRLVSYNSSTK